MKKKQVAFDLYKTGVVADLSFGTWGAATKLKEEDLGLKDIPSDKISLGRKKLLKKDRFKEINSTLSDAYYFFRRNSFEFPFGEARFVPYARLDKIVEKMGECEKKFYESIEDLFKEYDEDRELMIKEYDLVFDEILNQRNNVSDSERVVRKEILLSNLKSKYPTIQELRKKFWFDFTIFEVQSPEFRKIGTDEAVEKSAGFIKTQQMYQEKVSRKLDIFLEDVVSRLKKMVLDIVSKLNKRVEDDSIKMSSVNSFLKFAEAFREMDFVDSGIDKAIGELSKKLEGVDKSRLNDQKFIESLNKELEKVKDAADSIDYSKILGRFKRNLRVVDAEE